MATFSSLQKDNIRCYIIIDIIFGGDNNYCYLYSIITKIMEYPPIPVSKENYHKAMLKILNFSLNLSEMELNMVATLLNNKIHIIDTGAREILRKTLDKGKFITNNYIQRLKAKDILVVRPADKNLYLNPSLLEMVKDKKVTFEFTIHE